MVKSVDRRKMSFARFSVLGLSVFGLCSFEANAQETVPELVACTPASTSPADIEIFKANPKSILSGPSTTGAELSTRVRNLAGSDVTVINIVLEIMKSADPDQKSAIGAGLGQLAVACIASDFDGTAEALQQIALASEDEQFYRGFLAGSNAIETAAVLGGGLLGGALGGPVGGSLGQSGRSNFGSPSNFATVRQTTGTYTFGSAGGSTVEVTRNVSSTF